MMQTLFSWLVANIIPILALIVSVFVAYSQIQLKNRIEKESLVFSQNFKAKFEGYSEISRCLGRLLIDVGTSLRFYSNFQSFKSSNLAAGKVLVETTNTVNKYQLHLPKEISRQCGEILDQSGKHLETCVQVMIQLDNTPDQNREVLAVRLQDLIDEHHQDFQVTTEPMYKKLLESFKNDISQI